MIGRGIQVGTLWNRPVAIDASLFLVVGIFTLFGGLMVLPLFGMLFGLVFLHEMGHIAVALHFGHTYHGMVLHGLGGAALLEPKKEFVPYQETLIAIAGPAVNFLLCLLSFLASLVFPYEGIALLFYLNLIIGVFNLFPAYPMDGGRVVFAAVAHFWGLRAADKAGVAMGRTGGVLFIAYGIFVGWFLLAAVGAFLIWYSGKERRADTQTLT